MIFQLPIGWQRLRKRSKLTRMQACFTPDAAYYPRKKSVGLFRSTRGTPEQIRSIALSGYVPAICHPSSVLHVSKTLAIGGYRAGIQCEDADLWWRMALAYDVQFIPEVLLLFRQNAESLTSRNLRSQEVHGLYVQYLLLSQLEGREPEKLSEVEGELLKLLSNTSLMAKEKLRMFNIYLGQGRAALAMRELLGSFTTSPTYVLRRLRDELFPSEGLGNGVEPKLFQQRKNTLWPQHSST